MAVYEIHVRRNGKVETLLTDRRVGVGDRLRIGASVVVVTEQRRAAVNPLVTAAFSCTEEQRLTIEISEPRAA